MFACVRLRKITILLAAYLVGSQTAETTQKIAPGYASAFAGSCKGGCPRLRWAMVDHGSQLASSRRSLCQVQKLRRKITVISCWVNLCQAGDELSNEPSRSIRSEAVDARSCTHTHSSATRRQGLDLFCNSFLSKAQGVRSALFGLKNSEHLSSRQYGLLGFPTCRL